MTGAWECPPEGEQEGHGLCVDTCLAHVLGPWITGPPMAPSHRFAEGQRKESNRRLSGDVPASGFGGDPDCRGRRGGGEERSGARPGSRGRASTCCMRERASGGLWQRRARTSPRTGRTPSLHRSVPGSRASEPHYERKLKIAGASVKEGVWVCVAETLFIHKQTGTRGAR